MSGETEAVIEAIDFNYNFIENVGGKVNCFPTLQYSAVQYSILVTRLIHRFNLHLVLFDFNKYNAKLKSYYKERSL